MLEVILSIIGTLILILLTIIGFLLKSKFKEWDDKLNGLDSKMDFQITKQNEYDYRINKVELRLDKHSITIDDIDERLIKIETLHKINHND